jgi:hypothetical protein
MSETTIEATDVATDETNDGAGRGRPGRPRSQDTLTRDAVVQNAIAQGGKTKSELVAETGLTANAVYLSLFRLKRDRVIAKTSVEGRGPHVWYAVGSTPAPAPEPASTQGVDGDVVDE